MADAGAGGGHVAAGGGFGPGPSGAHPALPPDTPPALRAAVAAALAWLRELDASASGDDVRRPR